VVLGSLLFSPRADSEAEIAARPEAWTPGGGFFRKTMSGERVSTSRALTLSAYFAALRAISEDIGKLPLEIFRRDADGGKSRATDHPLYRLLRIAPNDEMSASVFRELMTGWALGWGNAFAEIERDGVGTPVAFHPIHPSRCVLRRINGKIKLLVMSADVGYTEPVTLDYSDVLHIRAFGDDTLCGLSIARLAAESIGVGLAAQTYGAAFFGNGATPSILLIHPGKLTAEAQTNLRESWKKRLMGGNKNGVAVLSEGIKAEKMSIPPEEAQFLETRQFEVSEMARWFRIPPHKIQDLTRSTNNNIEHQGIEYATDCLSPWMNRWEQEFERKCLDERDQEIYDIKHNDKALMRGDSKSRMESYRTAISTGIMTPNEARTSEDMNPSDSEGADKLYMQGAMMTLDQIVKGAEKPAAAMKPVPEEKPENEEEAKAAGWSIHYDESGAMVAIEAKR
jgi:HK97 family phage portal protein